ncbi:glycosyltransferase [Stenotrophomonas sp. Iso1]|uniref:glycosyltransferase n=1 Tax=Stenotrophomonas sp. Iso1 TaxID=2977283 RepID=UPI0022B7BA16|nr:glycosyltransferase [Stenotrophomonas sp. Iso1]
MGIAMSARKIRIGVSGHDLKFWYPLQACLESTGKYEFREDLWHGHEEHDAAKSSALIEWADVLIAEWALGNAVYYAANKRPSQKLYVRLHAQERRTNYPARIDYSRVDAIVFVGRHILQECLGKFEIPKEKCVVIGNLVDVERFRQAKFGGAEFVLGMIGIAPQSKRLDLALDTLELLLQRDPRYSLRIKGTNPASVPWLWARTSDRHYYESIFQRINSGSLRYKVTFDPPGTDVHHWLKLVGTLLSPSDHESFHMAVAEGAASGALPIVWSWAGSKEVYPEFPSVDTAAQAATLIDFYNNSAAGPRLREHSLDVISTRYGKESVSRKWDLLLQGNSEQSDTSLQNRRGRKVVAVWAIDDWSTFHRREMLEALAGHLAKTHDFLIIEPGNHYATIAKLGWAPPTELAEIAAGRFPRESQNIFRVRLFADGIPAGIQRTSYQGRSDLPEILNGLVEESYGRGAELLHWVYKPDQALRLPKSAKFIYEVYDEYTMNFGTGEIHGKMVEMEPIALQRADHVFFTSQPLLERKSAQTSSHSLVGNGVASEVFARYRVGRGESRKGRPVAGYLGNLSTFFDWGLMLEVCSSMPGVDFMFHGQIELAVGDMRCEQHAQMEALPNVFFSGRVDRVKGASAINRYDVLLIPFVVNDAMHAVNPLKLWEYFATGLPVISSPMDAIMEASPLIWVARTVQEWVIAINSALAADDVNAYNARIDRAEEHCWQRLTVAHAQVVESL